MSESTYAIVGILLTVVLGVPGIYFGIIRPHYAGKITLVIEKTIPLFDSVASSLPGLDISFNSKPINDRVVLLEGIILNSGGRDIIPTMIEEPISFDLKEGFKWVAATILSSSPNLRADLSYSERRIIFRSQLFRRNESVRFRALVEVPKVDDENKTRITRPDRLLSSSLKASHRIADTLPIVIENITTSEVDQLRKKGRDLIVNLVIATALLGFCITFFVASKSSASVEFYAPNEDGQLVKLDVRPQSDGAVHVKMPGNTDTTILSEDEFSSTTGLTLSFERRTAFPSAVYLALIISGSVCIVIWLILLGVWYTNRRHTQKLLSAAGLHDGLHQQPTIIPSNSP